MNTGQPVGCGARQSAFAEGPQAGSAREHGGRELALSKRKIFPGENATRPSGHAGGLFPYSVGSGQSSARSITDWVREISQAWGRGPANILELARLVCQARESLRYGEWTQLWRSPGVAFSKRNADRLVTIGTGLGEADETNWSHLPCAWRTLYYLAQLGWPSVKRLIEEGKVHPRMTIKEARALQAQYRPEMAQRPRCSTVQQWLARVAASLEQRAVSWSLEERNLVQAGLWRLAEQIQLEDSAHSTRSSSLNGCGHPFRHDAADTEQTCSSPIAPKLIQSLQSLHAKG